MSFRNAVPLKLRAQLAQAIELKCQDDLPGAARILEKAVEDAPDSAVAFWLLGGVYWLAGKLRSAIRSFRKAVTLSPQSEKASLALFHTLWAAGQRDKAVAEMRRFLGVARSKDYERIARELAEVNGLRQKANGTQKKTGRRTAQRKVSSSKRMG